MLITIGRGLSPLSFRPDSLRDVISSCVFDLDATKIASYPGNGQYWRNLTGDAAYTFTRGGDDSTSSDDPAFTGVAGGASSYFSMDGNDYMKLLGNSTPFLGSLAKTTGGTAWWMACAYRPVASTGSNALLGNQPSGSSPGILISQTTSNGITVQQRGDTASVSVATGSTIIPGTDTLVIISYNAGSIRSWVNTRSKTISSLAPNAGSNNPTERTRIGARSGSLFLENGVRLYAFSMGNSFIDDAEAGKLFNAYNARHGRTYA